ncbi:MetQ/NlpA family ABC transporter substrate-binding protein [Paenibacillus chondroitinus]|uniref:MetQ/NlpA family ABC transporter substrate-binding protein n=1 Tax=Paenibacillus chondroitinus TaxID=59842 RepID=A0ABU6D5V0_9BACL|nr:MULTISPECIES: MetQ/NlpA family ABC transporter substrate-binding protein [Paenibacillus]MCY9660036.1 MetQ/NlpA family ABC transporter substrate-binding protein [Paenibacillus anseongense]MEB4793105.1 MetQ/NlpA family ABC transporter substrate-binding protein [Paenibacillus chondroitinus]
MKKPAIRTTMFVILALTFLLAACSKTDKASTNAAAQPAASSKAAATANPEDKVIHHVMSDAGFNGEIVKILKAELAKDGYTLDYVVVNDIIQPNKIVNDGQADTNSFQHEAYFNQFVKDQGLKNISRAFYTTFTPSGLYSKKYKSFKEVPDGAIIGIPVDPANNGRALFMLRDLGLLKLKDGVDVIHATLKDITDNPHKYKFKEVDQLMLQRTLDDVDVGFLFAGTAVQIGYKPKQDALALETGKDLPYKGIVAVNNKLLGTPKVKALQKAYESQAIKDFYKEKYGDAIETLESLNK